MSATGLLHICEKCNEEFEIVLDKFGYACWNFCPVCGGSNDVWIKKKTDEKTKLGNLTFRTVYHDKKKKKELLKE